MLKNFTYFDTCHFIHLLDLLLNSEIYGIGHVGENSFFPGHVLSRHRGDYNRSTFHGRNGNWSDIGQSHNLDVSAVIRWF